MAGFGVTVRLYIGATLLAGLTVAAATLRAGPPADMTLLLVTCLVGSIAQIYKVEGSTQKSSYNLGLVVYGFAFFSQGLGAALIVAAVSSAAEWAWHRYPWFIQSFNIGSLAIALAAAYGAFDLTLASDSLASFHQVVAIALASALFTAINHLMVGMVIKLARGEGFSESGIFTKLTLVIDATLFLIGGIAALLWDVNPLTSMLAMVPLYLIYSTLRMPALQRQAVTDAKTGLFNARYFSESLQKELDRADRFDRPLTVIMGDLDLLRNINNTYGHLAGDIVLIGVAKIMKESVRDYDVVARFGGEEFAILMPETALEQALPRMEMIREAIEEAEFEVPTSVTPIRTTMSFGVSTRHRVGLTAHQIVHEADLAVYRAKLTGRNRICLLSDDDIEADDVTMPLLTPLPQETLELLDGRAYGVANMVPVLDRTTVLGDQAALTAATEPPSARGPAIPRRSPAWATPAYVAATAVLAVAAVLLVPLPGPGSLDWAGLVVVAAVATLAELLAIEIYAKDTSVSTSAAPFIAGVLLFGAAGAVSMSLLVAASAMLKHGSPPSRFVFNSSVHLLSGVVFLSIAGAVPGTLAHWEPWVQAAVTVGCALVLYLITTSAVTVALHLGTGESFRRIWADRFRWLAPYYTGLGLVGYAIAFSYLAAGPQGVLVVLVPLLLLRLGQKQYIDRTRGIVNQLRGTNAELQRRSGEVTQLSEELLMVLSKAVDLRDPYTAGHSEQVSRYASLIADEMGLPPERVDLVRKAGLLHDIGKLGIPETILRKPGRLTSPEYEHVKQHSAWGAHLLGESRAVRRLVPFLRHHHEHFDGSGYPDGLAGAAIPLEARILAVADAVDAMASDRSYRSALDTDTVMQELSKESGRQFDPSVVTAFHRVLEHKGTGIIVDSAQAVQSRFDEAGADRENGRDIFGRVIQLFPHRSSAV